MTKPKPLAKLQDLFLNLATEEVFPNLFRNQDLMYFNADRENAAQSIHEVIEGSKIIDINAVPYVIAAKEVAENLRAFDQNAYKQLPDYLKELQLHEMVDYYTQRFALILEGTNFAGKPMNVREYVSKLAERKYAPSTTSSTAPNLRFLE